MTEGDGVERKAMNWDCTHSEERLSDFLNGALPSEEVAAFSEHEAECSKCAVMVAQVGGLVHRMRQIEPVEPPERLVAKILEATLGPRKTQRGWEGWFGWVTAVWQPRFAMGVLSVATSLAIVIHATGLTPGAVGRADLNPVDMARSANRQAHLAYGRAMKFVDDLQFVYAIRSQLEPETQPQAPPAPEPAPEASPERAPDQQTQPKFNNPQPSSEAKPPGGAERNRAQFRDGSLLAFAVMNSGTRSIR